ncbi:Zn-dependent hydrolase [Miniphocaeibacter halophilus]|uniref:Zn-dependent hydrolase n=1 Tax=Miniphocaeibacter halophilus TaxID=2931922 RepID=A0AC61MWS7_9FIRM|nr:Zn-dependent hydrolase [Miniphocaeibacter halophilus]QQK07283.1 Zn-dependent hydrolase [Miniphocaeibacter halophilus]
MTHNLKESAKRVVSDLKELRNLTSTENGAQRVAWTPTWQKARNWFKEKVEQYGAEVTRDSAGNVWAKIQGESSDSIAIGSHIDSVPNGGWLDGALGVVVGIEIIRRYTEDKRKPKKTIYIVDWADEEGARYGRSCLGSAAANGSLDVDKIKDLVDINGIKYSDALRKYKVEPENMLNAYNELKEKNIKVYLELHIEQGPILENSNKDVACVYGIAGVERHYIDFIGQKSHAGSFPTELRQDAFLAAAESALEFRKIALKYNAVCTVGEVTVEPHVTTIVPGKCTISLDQRTIDKNNLKIIFEEAKDIVEKISKKNNVKSHWRNIHSIAPKIFDEELIELCKESVKEETGEATTMSSGPLHDAIEVAKIIPTVMMFAMSEKGLSHTKEENTPDDKLETAIRAFLRLVDKTIKK